MTQATRPAPWLEHAVFALAVTGGMLVAPGGPGWGSASANAVLAARLDRTAAAPLYGALADVAAWIPVGEPGLRLAALNAVLAAVLLAGVVAATRALVPKLPAAGAVGALLLALSPPVRDASGPGLLAAGGLVWALAAALGPARPERVGLAIGGCVVAIGAQPWLGAACLIAAVAWLARTGARRDAIALAVGAAGVAIVALWIGALGALPAFDASLGAAIAASGRGAGAIVVGAGLLGAAFAAVTGLPGARALLAVAVLAGVGAALVGGDGRGVPLLAVLAIGASLIPVAIVRAASPAAAGVRALGAIAVAGVPLVLVAAVAGAAPVTRGPGDPPARVATALVDDLPPGPGVVIATRDLSWFALRYAQAVAGARPDLVLAPPLPPTRADVVAADALRADRVVGGDVPAVGRLDVRRARPRGRGYQLFLAEPTGAREIAPPPARYGAGDGEREATDEALERALFEASYGRLDQAARAAGLAQRFGAADLAVLAATRPSRDRPALFAFVPAMGLPPGAWQLDLLGDDLAWVAGIAQPELPATAVAPRRLHAVWRGVVAKQTPADDPRVQIFGADAARATREMLSELAGSGSGSGSG